MTTQDAIKKARLAAVLIFDSHSNLELGLKVAFFVALPMVLIGYLGTLPH